MVSKLTNRFLTIPLAGFAPPIFAPTNPVSISAKTTEPTVAGILYSTHGPITANSGSNPPIANATNDDSAA